MKLSKFLLPLIIIIGFVVYLSFFTVKEINQAIVLQFGDPKRVIAEPGLQVKMIHPAEVRQAAVLAGRVR